MKDGVILVNTSRGGLICTEDLITGIRDHKFWAVGLDVYEEESDFVYEDMSEYILKTSTVQRLLSFPNVALTSHQGFFTEEALTNIAETTLQNAEAFRTGMELKTNLFIKSFFQNMDLFCPSRIVIWGFEDKGISRKAGCFIYGQEPPCLNFSLSYSGMAVLVASHRILVVIQVNSLQAESPMTSSKWARTPSVSPAMS